MASNDNGTLYNVTYQLVDGESKEYNLIFDGNQGFSINRNTTIVYKIKECTYSVGFGVVENENSIYTTTTNVEDYTVEITDSDTTYLVSLNSNSYFYTNSTAIKHNKEINLSKISIATSASKKLISIFFVPCTQSEVANLSFAINC